MIKAEDMKRRTFLKSARYDRLIAVTDNCIVSEIIITEPVFAPENLPIILLAVAPGFTLQLPVQRFLQWI